MKKLVSLLLACMLFLLPSLGSAEQSAEQADQEAVYDAYVENLRETDRSFTVPIGFGMFQSVTLMKDGIALAFKPIGGRLVSIGLSALGFLIDLKEVELLLDDGQTIRFPTAVKLSNTEVGTFIIVYITGETISSLSRLFSIRSHVARITFIQNSQNSFNMTMDEFNQALGSILGGTLDFVRLGASAVSVFWRNLKEGIGTFAANTHEAIEKAIAGTVNYLSDKWTDVSVTLSGAAESVGKKISDMIESTRKVFREFSESVTNYWQSLSAK